MTFKRGDGVIFVGSAKMFYTDRANEDRIAITVGKVTSISRDGSIIRKFRRVDYNLDVEPHRSSATCGARQYRLPKEDWDIEAVMNYCRDRPWSHAPEHTGAPFDSLDQARAELKQFRRKETQRDHEV